MRDETDQARYIVERVLENREAGTTLKQQAVLFRTSSHSGPLEIELTRRNIPFVKFGGLKFLDTAHVKDVLALLRFVENPRDRVAGFRVMQLLPGRRADVGAARARRHGRGGRSDCGALRDLPAPPRAGEDWDDFVATLSTACAPARPAGPPRWAARGSGTSRISSAFTRTPTARQADLLQLEQIAAGYPSRERFLTELTLDPPDATSDQAGVPLLDEDYLILSTIHSAKGQEWKSVFVLNVVDGCMPSDLGDRHDGRNRGGAPAALCRHDAGQGRPASDRAAALLHPRPACAGRPPRLCLAHPVHSGDAAASLRTVDMAGGGG